MKFTIPAAAALIPAIAALSTADILSVFPTSASDLTGTSSVLPSFTLSVVTNTTHALFSFNATRRPFEVGWMATAVGPSMTAAGSDYLICASNPATATGPALIPWTLSHRMSVGENMPTVAGRTPQTATSNYYTFLPALSTIDPASEFTVVSYLRLLTMPDSYPNPSAFKSISRARTQFMYASSTISPGSNAENAVLTQHDQPHATVTLDLSTPIVLAGVAPAPAASSAARGSSTGTAVVAASSSAAAASATAAATASDGPLGTTILSRSRRDMLLIAHAVLASFGLLLFTPAAIIVARYFRGFSWFPIHAALQLLAAACIVAAFGLGYYCVNGPHFFDSHTRIGLGLLILVLAQVVLGAVAHRIPSGVPSTNARLPTLSNKPAIRLIHIAAGIMISALGLYQVREGMSEYPEYSDGGENTPVGVIVVYWLLVAGIVSSYLYGWLTDNKRGRKDEGPRNVDGKAGEAESKTQF